MGTTVVIPGNTVNANIPIEVIPAGLSCSVGILLSTDSAGASIVYSSASKSFTSTGASQTVTVPVTVPSSGGVWYPWVSVALNGISVGAFAQGSTLTGQQVQVGTVTWS